VEYWHWLLVEAQPEIATFCEEPVPTHRYDAKLPALADVWLRRTDGSIEFRSIARSERQISSTARLLEETFGDGFIHRALSKEDVLSEPFLLDNSLRIVSFLSSSGPETSMDLLSSIEEAFRISQIQTLGEVVDRLGPRYGHQRILVALFGLIHQGTLRVNLYERIIETIQLRWEGPGSANIAP